jgi:hypothetical protein
LEYRLESLEWNGLKGMIGEHLARSYIRNKLARKIIDEEGWNHVVLSNNDYKLHRRVWNQTLFSFDLYREDFLVHGFCACSKLLARYAEVVGVLLRSHCSPDGLLFKLREVGEKKKLNKDSFPAIAKLRFDPDNMNGGSLEFPVVEGDLEVLEIKCGRHAKLIEKQKETYDKLITKGVPLRVIEVRIVSFDSNQFLVEERKFQNLL